MEGASGTKQLKAFRKEQERSNKIIEAPFAEIKEIKTSDAEDKERLMKWANIVRVYHSRWDKKNPGMTFQIRTNKPTVDGGKPRLMYATVELTLKQLKEIVSYAESVGTR